MLSVLIPVHNDPVASLVRELHRQALDLDIAFEILMSDDASVNEIRDQNQCLEKLDGITFFQQDKQLGRAANRNFLADRASMDYLLFVDGDAGIISDRFLARYLGVREQGRVVCGGTAYSETPPQDHSLFLRWFYGWRREVRPVRTRLKDPGRSFSSFNFLIPRNLFLAHPFEEEIRDYGHEDTLFGARLTAAGYEINHIDNPLLHMGLEPGRVFLEKSLTAVGNLHRLLHDTGHAPYLRSIRLVQSYRRAKATGLAHVIRPLLPVIRKISMNNLTGNKPDLLLFDLLKLSYMLSLDK